MYVMNCDTININFKLRVFVDLSFMLSPVIFILLVRYQFA
jgi:hypothetical protein